MGNEWHYAVVAGIDEYPEIDGGKRNLNFPKSDAEMVIEWLRADHGGGMRPEHAMLLTRAEPPGRAMPVPLDREIYKAITKLVEHFRARLQALPDDDAREAAWKQSRFYLYLSGHGLDAGGDDAVVLAADSQPMALGYHVSSRNILNQFKHHRVFAQVVILVDACREFMGRTVNDVPFDLTPPSNLAFSADVRCFFAAACKTGKRAYEPDQSGDFHNGIFTHALLTALRVGFTVGTVNAESLGNYLQQSVPQLAHLCEKPSQNPDILERDKEILFQTTPGLRMRIHVTAPPASPFAGGKTLEAAVYFETVVISRTLLAFLADGSFEAHLCVGLYSIQFADADPARDGTPEFPVTVIKDNMEIVLP